MKNYILHALDMADSAISKYPRNIYPYLTRLEIAYKSRQESVLLESLEITENAFKDDKESEVYMKFPYYACKCMSYVIKGEERQAKEYFETKVRKHFSEGITNELKRRLCS